MTRSDPAPPEPPETLPHAAVAPAVAPRGGSRPGERTWPRDFTDRLTHPIAFGREAVSAIWYGRLAALPGDPDQVPVRRTGLPPACRTDLAVTWVGHATFVLRVGGLTVLTDPVWSRSLPGVRHRLTPPGLAWSDLPRVDAVVISHDHYDHLDAPTIRRLPRNTAVFVPAALGRWFTRRGFTEVVELDWWEHVTLGDVTFDFVPAHHWSRRGPFDACRTLWGGWVLTSGRHRVYFAGDTAYGDRLAQIGARYPGIDLALMPVGAYEPRRFTRDAHVDPEEAVLACADVGARRMATMHWGTFALSAEEPLAPVREARKAWAAQGRDPAELWDLAVGETRFVTG